MIKKFNRATSGRKAVTNRPPRIFSRIEYAKKHALISASHFIFIGMIKNSVTRCSGKSAANAKNIDKFRKYGVSQMGIRKGVVGERIIYHAKNP